MMLLLLFTLLVATCSSAPINVKGLDDLPPLAKQILDNMDQTIDPCDDFYQFSCGGWIKKNPIPPSDSSIIRSFSMIGDYNNKILLDIFNNPKPNQDPRVQQLFQTCMNVTAADQLGNRPLSSTFALINTLSSLNDLGRVLAKLHQIGVTAFFDFGSAIDSGDPSINLAQLDQGGLFLPQEVYQIPDVSQRYLQHITNILVLAGLSQQQASSSAEQALLLETLIANITVSQDEEVDPFKTYNKLSLAQLKSLVPSFNWDSYFGGLGFSVPAANVIVPDYFRRLNQLFASQTVTVGQVQSYLLWQYAHSYAPVLSSAFVNETFQFFGSFLDGQQQPTPRDQFCVSLVDQSLGELLGSYYAAVAFSGESKTAAQTMVSQIEGAMKANLETLSWMDDTTRQQALKKLSQVYNMIGYPDKPNQYSGLNILPNRLYDSFLNAQNWSFFFTANQNGKPSDRTVWEMTADTINAYYEPTRNEMVFPAGILQFPYFNVSQPTPLNFGGGGFIMGHELTHGFDNQGKDYDGTGLLRDWWQPATEQVFNQRAACVINQYSSFEVLPGVYIDGNKTQGENIADMGGLKNSYNAYLTYVGPKEANATSIVPTLSNIQLFFVGIAQGWCENITPQALKQQVEEDVHSPARYRVIGPMMNFQPFSEVWQCPSGSKMNPAKKCAVW